MTKSNLVEMGIYSPRSENSPGGLAILTEAGAGVVKFVIVEENEINQPLSFAQRGVFTLPQDQFIALFEFTGMYERRAEE